MIPGTRLVILLCILTSLETTAFAQESTEPPEDSLVAEFKGAALIAVRANNQVGCDDPGFSETGGAR